MFDQSYTTPEGFALHRPLLLPDARSFADVLEYVSEWDHQTMTHRGGKLPEGTPRPEPRYLELGHDGIGATMRSLTAISGLPREPFARNEVGPFCTVDLSQIGGPRRSMAVRATDAVMEAVAPRIATDDDHLSFQLIAHAGTGRVLVTLQHGQISGSHYLAYIDPATIPAYPYATRDAVVSKLCDRIKAATAWVPWRRDLSGGEAVYGYDGWYPEADSSKRLQRRGQLPQTRPIEVARIDATGKVAELPEGMAHLRELERARDAAQDNGKSAEA